MDLGAKPPGIKLCWVPPPPSSVVKLFQAFSNLWKLMEF